MDKYVLKISKKSFDKEGDKIEYFCLTANIDNQKISLTVKDDDKKLFKYLMTFHKFNERGEITD